MGSTVAKSPKTYDLIIAGATPAGAAAAIRARRAGLSCLILKPEPPATHPQRLDWLGPVGIDLCQTCGLDARAVGAAEFTGLRLYSWDLKQHARVTDADLSGWIVERGAFGEALLEVAGREGADVLAGAAPQALTLGESYAALSLHRGREVRGRILLIAEGLDSPTAAMARIPTARQADGVALSAEVVFETASAEAGLDVIIGARRSPQTVTVLRAGRWTGVTLVTWDRSSSAEAQLAEFLAAAQQAKLVSDNLVAQPAGAVMPAGIALDMETLVAKRCLLIGEAAGFVTAFSNELIYPTMKSGWVAAEAAARALRAPVLQDELLSFSPAWRAELADYLRLPNTDLALLMPLVFNNPQMSGRIARAFLLGQSF